MSSHQYAGVYIIRPVINSISGRHTITEEDLGLPKGTLPPDDVASLGSLITVDKEHLKPFNSIRTRTKRLCESKGVRVGLGTVIPSTELRATLDQLEDLKDEFYKEKEKFLKTFSDNLNARLESHKKYANLIQASAPSKDYVDQRMHFAIDTLKVSDPSGDPNSSVLSSTLTRPGNDIGHRLFQETVDFVQSAYNRSFKDTAKVVRRNLTPFRESLLPKLRSFQLLDSRCRTVADHVEQMLADAEIALKALPHDEEKAITGPAYDHFLDQLNRMRSLPDLEALANSKPANVVVAPKVQPQPTPKTETPKADVPVRGLPRNPNRPAPSVVNTTGRKVITF
jgi:hypothetical protein